MKTIFKYILAAATLPMSLSVFAQSAHSSYFLENMTYRQNMNPAFAPDFNYVNIPALGGFQLGMNSNVGLGSFLFPQNDEMVTGLNSSISPDEFLGKLSKNNIMELDMRVNILSFGFAQWGGFNTFSVSTRSNIGAYLPYELFEFAKIGQIDGAPTEYDINNIRVKTSNYAEFALGHSRKITDKLSVGAKLKILAGILNSDAEISNLNVYMSGEKWQIKESGRIFSSNSLNVNFKENGEIDNLSTSFGINGFGLGLDLGASYKMLDNLTLSAAITDIGFISWKGEEALANPEPFVFDGFTNIGGDDPITGESSVDSEVDQIKEDLKGLTRFSKEQKVNKSQTLTTTLNVGAEYGILDNKISFGLLSSTRFGMPVVWTEVMAAANFRPTSWFNASINGNFSNIRQSMGVMLNFCPKGFNFFIGSDYIPFKYSKEGIPLYNAKFNLLFGMSFTFNHKG